MYGVAPTTAAACGSARTTAYPVFNPRTGQVTTYGVSDGLQATEFNFGAWYQSPAGGLYFGGINGFNAFNPSGSARSRGRPRLS